MKGWFKRDPHEAAARALYAGIVAQARQPAFYRDWGLPDTVDGRFDLIVLHVFLAMHRLKGERAESDALSQALFDVLFQDLDQSLREMGAGDIGVARRIRTMAEGFYGRVMAYEQALGADDETLGQTVARNLFGTSPAEPVALAAVAGYIRREARGLAEQDVAAILAGKLVFGPVPDRAPGAGGADPND